MKLPIETRNNSLLIMWNHAWALWKQHGKLLTSYVNFTVRIHHFHQKKYNDCLLLKIERGLDCRVGLNRLFQVHSTAFYLKATMSAQIKNLLLAGRRLSWQDLSNDINEFRIDVSHEQLFIAQMSSAKHILSKIDSTTSMTMSSKLAYQLTKLSHWIFFFAHVVHVYIV